jgi:hypothetical protein
VASLAHLLEVIHLDWPAKIADVVAAGQQLNGRFG